MGYALFAQRKLVLTANLNTVELLQTQRSQEQYNLATKTLSLQQQLSSLNAAQANELADLYAALNDFGSDGGTIIGSDGTATQYEVGKESEYRQRINDTIKEKEKRFEDENDDINREIYKVSMREQAIEMEVKRLDTQVTALQKQLEAVQEAESAGIDRATPKFKGVG